MKKLYVALIFLLALFLNLQAQVAPSLFSDIKASNVGDVLSVILVEKAYASQGYKNTSSTNSGTEFGAASGGNLVNFLPVFSGSGSYDSDTKAQDGSQQEDRLSGRLTVRITEKVNGGLLKIKGEREVGVNGEDNVMILEGFIRARDISTDNTIYSYHIADAKIDYRKSGIANKFIAPGTFPKIFSFLVGGLMVAAGAGYFVFN